jgi:hypothetical protein
MSLPLRCSHRGIASYWQGEGDAATILGMERTTLPQRAPATDTTSYAGYRFAPDVIS